VLLAPATHLSWYCKSILLWLTNAQRVECFAQHLFSARYQELFRVASWLGPFVSSYLGRGNLPASISKAAARKHEIEQRFAFGLQAADLLAIQSHVQDVCSALAARLLESQPTRPEGNTQLRPAQVLLCSPEKLWVVQLSVDANSAAIV
jgi:hypothetical protein